MLRAMMGLQVTRPSVTVWVVILLLRAAEPIPRPHGKGMKDSSCIEVFGLGMAGVRVWTGRQQIWYQQ